ncbi:MAG: hypothetical protein A2V66_05285 [Ignavibacteria bacterium RBG_13_36_8]|nr:MAG: hypothetical protein A2V66_05285 [Ignavibacteria bacterium RBG_13_36_8]
MNFRLDYKASFNTGHGMLKFYICFIPFVILILLINTSAQSRQADTKMIISDSYFNQKSPGDTAEIFSPGIISTNNHEHSRLVQSKNGLEYFWAVVITNEKDIGEEQKIWYTRRNKDGWLTPKRIPVKFTETRSPALSPDGRKLYFLSNDPDSNPNEMPSKSILWEKEMVDSSWDHIRRVEGILPQMERRMVMSFCFASNGNLYFDAGGPDETGKWSWRIYFSECKNGIYLEPQLMGDMINEGRICQYPFIASDESYLIFSSDREGTFGSGDLYISYRNTNGKWSIPVNMEKSINTSSQERSPSVSTDGRYLFFTRHNKNTLQDFFWIDAKIINTLKTNK